MDDYEYGIPDPEYGVFGDTVVIWDNERNLRENSVKYKMEVDEKGYIKGFTNLEAETSRNFNLYMIEIYNKAVK